MRVTIVTPSWNSVQTLPMTISSVALQDYPDIEHIVVDGGSVDGTLELLEKTGNVRYLSQPDRGIYDAINKGMRIATGDVVGVLNADDFLASPGVISEVANELHDHQAVYRDVAYVRADDLSRIVRMYSSRDFRPGMFLAGFMPAHPSFYARRTLFEAYGPYKTDYRICGDFELLLRFLLIHGVRASYLPGIHTVMRTGGVSNANALSRFQLNREMVKACRENGIPVRLIDMLWKYPVKAREYLRPGLDLDLVLHGEWVRSISTL